MGIPTVKPADIIGVDALTGFTSRYCSRVRDSDDNVIPSTYRVRVERLPSRSLPYGQRTPETLSNMWGLDRFTRSMLKED